MTTLQIDRADDWREYWGSRPLPNDWEALGTVTDRETGETGALVHVWPVYLYAQGNQGGGAVSVPTRGR